MAAHAIRTPLSRYLVSSGDRDNCVIRNRVPLSDLTPEETGAMLKRAKPLIAKLGLNTPPRVVFVIAYGDSISKVRRAERAISPRLFVDVEDDGCQHPEHDHVGCGQASAGNRQCGSAWWATTVTL